MVTRRANQFSGGGVVLCLFLGLAAEARGQGTVSGEYHRVS